MSARKSPDERTNRKKVVYADVPICWDGKTRGFPLPDGYQWCRMTRWWWETIRNSPQAMVFQETDWLVFLETAFLHQKLWGKSTKITRQGRAVEVTATPAEATTLAGEIRRRVESYGFTWADRRKYGISITTPEEAAAEAEQITRQSAVDYRKKLDGLS